MSVRGARIALHLINVVRAMVEETLNALLDAYAGRASTSAASGARML